MPSLFSRLSPGPGRCPRWLLGRRPRRLRRPPPPPPEGLPGPAFIVLSSCCVHVAEFLQIPKTPPVAGSRRFKRGSAHHTNSDLRNCCLLYTSPSPRDR